MKDPKVDGVIEAVRYNQNRQIDMVRLYERRGAVFTDVILLDRNALVERLRKGRRFFTGRRQAYLASTFKIDKPVTLQGGSNPAVTTDNRAGDKDLLVEVPVF